MKDTNLTKICSTIKIVNSDFDGENDCCLPKAKAEHLVIKKYKPQKRGNT